MVARMVVKPSRWIRDARRAELRALATRSKQVVFWAAATGVLTGLAVAAFDWLVDDQMVDRLLGADLWMMALLPGAGLLISWIVRRSVAPRTSTSNADEYLRSFHDASISLRWRPYLARMVASIATLGLGGPMGLEGPSVYTGGTIGSALQRRMPKTFRDADRRVLLVAGAAAGVAAIFKAPATGAVFALEVPYHDDLARRMLLPALVASATGYLTFVALHGTAPLFAIDGSAGFSLRDLLGAIAVGVVAGVGARLFSWALRRAKRIAGGPHALVGAFGGGAALATIFVICRLLTGESLTFGPGYPVVEWASSGDRSVLLLVVILLLRCAGTAAAVAGGGVGGLFIPLVVAGALTGSAIGTAVDAPDLLLFVVIGMAAFLGAGYRVPLAAVMFVAETTGRPAYVVPGLLAAVAAELIMGASSVTAYQRPSERAISRALETSA
jgi:CIC family chloride channel protein